MSNQIKGYRLSPQQERIWSLLQDGLPCLARCFISVEGAINPPLLKEALLSVVSYHQVLRTTFHRPPGIKAPIQVICDEPLLDWHFSDLSDLPPSQQPLSMAELADRDRSPGFDLQNGPTLRATLISTAPTRHKLILSLPSLCCDRRGMTNLAAGLAQAYASAAGNHQPLEEPVQYVQFSEWQNQLLEDEEAQAGRDYWASRGLAHQLDLRVYGEGKAAQTSGAQMRVVERVIEAELAGKIEQMCRVESVEQEAMMLACWAILLGRLTGSSEVVVAQEVDARKYEEMEAAIGAYANWVPVRCEIEGSYTFADVLRQVKEAAGEAYQWQEYYDWPTGLGASRSIGYEYEQQNISHGAGGVRFSITERQACTDKFKLKLRCVSEQERLAIHLHYDTSIYPRHSISRLAEQFATLLSSALANPQSAVSDLGIVSDGERRLLVEGFNQTHQPYPPGLCIHELIERQAELTPHNVAVACGQEEVTYAELERRANQLANYLRGLGVGPEQVVAVCMGRGVEVVVALVAILKAGGAYLPVDVGYPAQRQRYMLEDAGVKVMVSEGSAAARPAVEGVMQVDLLRDRGEIERQSERRVSSGVSGGNLAYVIYTSGSTGKPKGVMIEHRGVVNYLSWASDAYRVEAGGGSLVHTSIGFDLTVTSLYCPLVAGQRVEMITEQEGVEGLRRALSAGMDYSLVKITPSHLQMLGEVMSEEEVKGSSRVMVIGGEALRAETLRKWRSGEEWRRLINEYGPTETVVGCCVYEVKQEDGYEGEVLIGRPIANTQIYILGEGMSVKGVGEAGEIYIGGEGVGRGYKGRADLTGERFVPDPYGRKAGGRLYRTGDQGRWLPTGDIEYLGRGDNQVKVRGYRVELGEIEAEMSRCEGVREAAAVAVEEQGGGKRVVGYVVWRERGEVVELKRELRERLPEYMVPGVIMELEEMPLTRNGKVDRHSLPAPREAESELYRAFVTPRTVTEEILVDLWAEVLGLQVIRIHDNFFELGGHSLLATQLFSRLKRVLNVEMPLRTLFESPTVASLAEKVDLVC